tara:strand:+ start:1039 stop:1308 length:270 start_codon:yes stop_codon:yes gene_type:complete
MKQEQIMLQRAASGRIFMMGAILGGGSSFKSPPPPPPTVAPAVNLLASAKSLESAHALRRRQARAGAPTMITGGSSVGGSTGGQTLMGA